MEKEREAWNAIKNSLGALTYTGTLQQVDGAAKAVKANADVLDAFFSDTTDGDTDAG